MSSENVEKIDLITMALDLLRAAKRLLWAGVLLIVLSVAAFGWVTYQSYTPSYQATASFTIYVSDPLQAEVKAYNTATAEQMAKTFPYILTSNVLSDVVMEELGISSMPSVSASVLSNTNIFTLTVTSSDPQLAYDVLNAVMEYYPSIAEFVVGSTEMTLLDESGVPTTPVNSISYRSAVKYGVAVGFVLWAAILLLVTLSRSTIRNEEELKQLINLRCIGVLPLAKGMKNNTACPMLTRENDKFGFSESVRLLRIRLEKELQEQNYKVLLISSAIPGEGKTTTSANLAAALASKGKRTLLVDCDLRNPSVGKAFGIEHSLGLSEYLNGTTTMHTVIQSTQWENLSVISGGEAVGNAAELLAGSRMREFLQSVRDVYDYVILDTPPCSMLADAAEVAALADCAVLTIRQDYASRDQILEGAQLLAGGEVPLIGCVLNCAKRSVESDSYSYYGYGYGYGYHRRYGEHKSAD